MSFFYGFGDELIKQAGPLDWIKRKLGMQPKPVTKPAVKPKVPTPAEQAGKALKNAPKNFGRMMKALRGKPVQ
jgi:hypothetical protein